MNQKEIDVFISYSRKDFLKNGSSDIRDVDPNSVVSKLIRALEEKELEYWYDKEGIVYSEKFLEKIGEAISKSRTLVFVSSAASNESKYVSAELNSAQEYRIPILPFRVDDTPYAPSILAICSGSNHISYEEHKEKAFEMMADAIKELVNLNKSKIQKIKQKIKEYEDQIVKLDYDYQNEIKNFKLLGYQYTSRFKEREIVLREEIDRKQQVIDSLNKNYNVLDSTLQATEKEVNDVRNKYSLLESKHLQLKTSNEELTKTNNELSVRLKYIETEFQSLQNKISELQENSIRLHHEKELLVNSLNEGKKEIQKSKEECKEKDNEITKLKIKNDSERQTILNLQNTNSSLNKNVKGLKKIIAKRRIMLYIALGCLFVFACIITYLSMIMSNQIQ